MVTVENIAAPMKFLLLFATALLTACGGGEDSRTPAPPEISLVEIHARNWLSPDDKTGLEIWGVVRVADPDGDAMSVTIYPCFTCQLSLPVDQANPSAVVEMPFRHTFTQQPERITFWAVDVAGQQSAPVYWLVAVE